MVIDQGIPCAFFATPQSYRDTLDKFAKVTGYRIEQWVGRMAPAVILSDVIDLPEVMNVARAQFPEFTEEQLLELAERACLSAGYLKNIDLAGRRARFLARERGHIRPAMQDLLDACADMMPEQPHVIEAPALRRPSPVEVTDLGQLPRQVEPAAGALRSRGNRPAAPLPEAGSAEFPRRSNRPERVETTALLKV